MICDLLCVKKMGKRRKCNFKSQILNYQYKEKNIKKFCLQNAIAINIE